MHGFEFLFVRIAPITFLASVVGIVATYKKRYQYNMYDYWKGLCKPNQAENITEVQ